MYLLLTIESLYKATVKVQKNPPHFSTLHFVGKDDALRYVPLTMVGVGLAYFDSTRFSLRWIRIANS